MVFASTFSAAVLKILYDIDVAPENDETLAIIEEGLLGSREVIVSGGFLVDYFHFLRHMPSFVPFQRQFTKWRKATKRMHDAPFERYKRAVVCG